MDRSEDHPGGGRWWQRLDPRWLVYAVVATVAAFCFVVSYSHIYDLGRAHAQAGTAARLLPLSVDGLIVAATLVLFIQGAAGGGLDGLARWLPRGTLWAAIAATVLANVAYGLPSGWLSAVVSGWPGAAFVAAVEVGVVVARPGVAKQPDFMPEIIPAAGQGVVPSNVVEAATVAYAASVAAAHPLPERQLVVRFGISRAEARKIRAGSPAPAVSPPGAGAGVTRGRGGPEVIAPATRTRPGRSGPVTRPGRPAAPAPVVTQDTPAGAGAPSNGQAHG